MRYFTLILLAAFVLNMLTYTGGALAQTSVRDDSLKIACLESGRISRGTGGQNWCQCQSDYYTALLSDADWDTYINDYYALRRKQSGEYSTKAYSYERNVQIGDNYCQTCAQNDYQGCLRDDGVTPSVKAYDRLLEDVRDGQFSRVQKNAQYKSFFVDFINGYSAFCGDRLTSYTERTVTVDTWKSIDHIWYKSDTTSNTTRIETGLLSAYENYAQVAQNQLLLRLTGSFLQAIKNDELPTGLLSETMTSVVDPVIFMRGKLAGQCDSLEIQTGYDNLKRFQSGREPMVPATLTARRSQADLALARRYEQIRELTRASAKRGKLIYQQEQARKAALPKGQFSCEATRSRGQAAATHLTSRAEPGAKNWAGMEGAWEGDFYGQRVEVVLWNTGPGKIHTLGFGYFPEHDCLMSVQLGVGRRPRESDAALSQMDFKMFSPKWRAGNCLSMVIEDVDREVHFFNVIGSLQWSGPQQAMTWYPERGKLGRITPQQCTTGDLTFTPSRLSPAFAALLGQYKHPDKYASPIPASVLGRVQH